MTCENCLAGAATDAAHVKIDAAFIAINAYKK
jgi:hypothetical protein